MIGLKRYIFSTFFHLNNEMPSLVIHARYDRDDIAEKILPALAGFTIFSAFATLMTRMGHLRKRFIALLLTL